MGEEKKKELTELRADYGGGLGCLRTTLISAGLALVVALTLILIFCMKKVEAWEVGLRYYNFISIGIINQGDVSVLEPGYNVIIPKLHEFTKYDCSIQRFEMAPAYPNMPIPDLQALKVRTARDQDEIDVYVTIIYHVDRKKAMELRKSYSNDEDIRRGIRSVCPQILQTYLGKIMTANQFYSMSKKRRLEILEARLTNPGYLDDKFPADVYLLDRSTQAEEARKEMNVFFQSRGVEIVDVLIWDFKFKDEIEASIISKVIAQEKVEMESALKAAADARASWQKLVAEANAAANAERGRGTAGARKIDAEAGRYRTEKEAVGDRMILEAQAEGKGKINQALAGKGGQVYVGLEYAKALEGLDLIVLPAGGPEGLNPLDLDQTLRQLQPGVVGGGGGK